MKPISVDKKNALIFYAGACESDFFVDFLLI